MIWNIKVWEITKAVAYYQPLYHNGHIQQVEYQPQCNQGIKQIPTT